MALTDSCLRDSPSQLRAPVFVVRGARAPVVSFQPVAARARLVHDRALTHDAARHRALLPTRPHGTVLLRRELLLARGTDVAQPPQTRTLVRAVVDRRPLGAPAGRLAVPESVRAAVGQVVYIGWVVIIVSQRLSLGSPSVIIIVTIIIIIIVSTSALCILLIIIVVVVIVIIMICIAIMTELVLCRA